MSLTRRTVLGSLLAGAAAASLPTARALEGPPRRYLIVIGGPGGASIIDSFLPVAASESANAEVLTTHFDHHVLQAPGSNIRCVAPLIEDIEASFLPMQVRYEQATFLERYGDITTVMTMEGSSVNHRVGQVRAMTGNGIHRGQTLLEAVGVAHGEGMPLPVVNMMGGGLGEPGTDPSLPIRAQQLSVQDPRMFAMGTHGSLGLPHAPDARLLARARAAQRELDGASVFATRFAHTSTLRQWNALRQLALSIEDLDLLPKLLLRELPNIASPLDLELLQQTFPALLTDVFEAQAALSYLLLRNGLTCAVGLAPRNGTLQVETEGGRAIENPQLAFDYSHNNHRVGQNVMWARMLRVADGLIGLLGNAEDPCSPGQTLLDNSVVCFLTEFGRGRERPPNATVFGSGHFQNNGVVLVSPRIGGNRVFGAVDPDTCLTYGFDPVTGEARPGTHMSEEDVYSVVATGLDVDFSGRRSLPCLFT